MHVMNWAKNYGNALKPKDRSKAKKKRGCKNARGIKSNTRTEKRN